MTNARAGEAYPNRMGQGSYTLARLHGDATGKALAGHHAAPADARALVPVLEMLVKEYWSPAATVDRYVKAFCGIEKTRLATETGKMDSAAAADEDDADADDADDAPPTAKRRRIDADEDAMEMAEDAPAAAPADEGASSSDAAAPAPPSPPRTMASTVPRLSPGRAALPVVPEADADGEAEPSKRTDDDLLDDLERLEDVANEVLGGVAALSCDEAPQDVNMNFGELTPEQLAIVVFRAAAALTTKMSAGRAARDDLMSEVQQMEWKEVKDVLARQGGEETGVEESDRELLIELLLEEPADATVQSAVAQEPVDAQP